MKTKIDLNDSMMDVMTKMSEGNSGALTVCLNILKNGEAIDPDNAIRRSLQRRVRTTIMWQDHPDKDVQQAIIRLNDALCTWERSTGRQSVLIIREEGGFNHRSMSGKPGIPDDVPDTQLLGSVLS